MSRLGRNFRRASAQVPTLLQRAINTLRKFGTDAHVWLPGVGTVNGLTANNYLLTDASTGLAPVDQYVGRVSDALGGLGVELITNGDFSNGVVNWVEREPGHWAVVGGRAYHVFSPLYKELLQTFTEKPAGPSYKISVSYEVVSGYALFFYLNAAGTVQIVVFSGSSGVVGRVITDGIQKIGFSRSSSGGEFYIDNISVREVTGISLTQATTASKPKLVRGAVNLLTYSGDYSAANWAVTGSGTGTTAVKTPNYGAAPDGTQTACRVQLNKGGGTTTNDISEIYHATVTPSSTETQTRAMWVKSLSGTPTIAVGGTGSLVITSEWQLIPLTSIGGERVRMMVRGGQTTPHSDTADLLIWTSGLFAGTLTASQLIALGGLPLTTTAPASTALGSFVWQFDGSNDSLALSSVPFQQSDDHYVCAAFSVNVLGVNQAIFSVSDSTSTTPIIALVYVDGATNFIAVLWRDNAGNPVQFYASTPVVKNTKYVVSASKVGTTYSLRVNGIAVASTTATLLTTTCNTATAGALVSTTTTHFLNGDICYLNATKATTSASELLLLEKLAASAAGIQL